MLNSCIFPILFTLAEDVNDPFGQEVESEGSFEEEWEQQKHKCLHTAYIYDQTLNAILQRLVYEFDLIPRQYEHYNLILT